MPPPNRGLMSGKPLLVRMDDKLRDRVDTEAAFEDLPAGEFVRRVLREYLDANGTAHLKVSQ